MSDTTTEYFPLVNEAGEIIGSETRQTCHSGTFLLHPVVHLHVLNSQGQLYLQKRSNDKDVQPGKWDTSVGGHVNMGETIETALARETREELGIRHFEPVFITRYRFESDVEAELVNSFYTIYDGEIQPDSAEISEGRFWDYEEITRMLGENIFTPNFESEFQQLNTKGLLPIRKNHMKSNTLPA